jgi:hypothetical protein
MGPHVYLESSGPRIDFSANIAGMRLFTSVDEQMRGKMAPGSECLVTSFIGARERSLTCMDARMSLQITCFIESLETIAERAEDELLSDFLLVG